MSHNCGMKKKTPRITRRFFWGGEEKNGARWVMFLKNVSMLMPVY
jgi:hypothetical protein